MYEKLSSKLSNNSIIIFIVFCLLVIVTMLIILLALTLSPLMKKSSKTQKPDSVVNANEQELNMNILEEIQYSGYHVENYTVETKDGYILQMFRIPHGKHLEKSDKGTIFLMHGIGCDSSIFIDDLNTSLAFLISDAGFDVWLGNARGNAYGSQHKTLTIVDDAFWNFSWDEISTYDLPAQLSLVLNVTNATKIFYAGQWLGNTVGMMLLASQPQWNEKIKGFLGLHPMSRLTYTTWPLTRRYNWFYKLFASYINVFDIMSHSRAMHDYVPKGNEAISNSQRKCQDMREVLLGIDWPGYNPTTISKFRDKIYFKHCSSGTSYKAMIHVIQASMSDELYPYSYGSIGNIQIYAMPSQVYNFSKVTVPVALFTSENDPIANPLDVSRLIKDLPNVYTHFVHPFVMYSSFETQVELTRIMKEKLTVVLTEMAKI